VEYGLGTGARLQNESRYHRHPSSESIFKMPFSVFGPAPERRNALELLPRGALVKTGDVDHADWNYDGLLGMVSRQRFALVRDLLPPYRVGRLLEVGYGSGIFLPELARHAYQLFGADIHERSAEIEAVLGRAGIGAKLVTSPAESLPYPDGWFDVVVAVSTFEFVRDPSVVIAEFARVLQPGGCVVIVTPSQHPLLDAALALATGESAARDFGDRRKLVVPALMQAMRMERAATFPPFFPVPIYRAFRLGKRSAVRTNVAQASAMVRSA